MPAQDEIPPAEALVRSIGGLAVRLSEVMSKETALLNAGRTSDIAMLQPIKADLARAYAGRWAQLKAARAELAGLVPNLTEALRQQVARMTEAAIENEKTLRRVQRAADRVLAIIAQTVREQRTASTGYTRDNLATRHVPGTLGFALDRRF
ncbi:MAG TPA: hypothetical protein VHT04_10720 [Stellaceae bacterium]|jgi:hypothetical protein|nr:hypothetical protein [Stellaceae bacterium]